MGIFRTVFLVAVFATVGSSSEVEATPSTTKEPSHADAGASAHVESAGPDTDMAAQVPSEDMAVIQKLVAALRANDPAAVSRLIEYPIARSQPLTPIDNAEAFIRLYSDFFDAKTISEIIETSKSPWHSWQGTCVAGVWIGSGKIFRLVIETAEQRQKAAEAKAAEALTLHPSVRSYARIRLDCITKRHHVRIHEVGKQAETIGGPGTALRYIAWTAGAKLNTAPEISLMGTVDDRWEGYRVFTFKRGVYQYEVTDPVICTGEKDACEPNLAVSEGKRILSNQVCRRLRSW
jgi:hypothetical protein